MLNFGMSYFPLWPTEHEDKGIQKVTVVPLL